MKFAELMVLHDNLEAYSVSLVLDTDYALHKSVLSSTRAEGCSGEKRVWESRPNNGRGQSLALELAFGLYWCAGPLTSQLLEARGCAKQSTRKACRL